MFDDLLVAVDPTNFRLVQGGFGEKDVELKILLYMTLMKSIE